MGLAYIARSFTSDPNQTKKRGSIELTRRPNQSKKAPPSSPMTRKIQTPDKFKFMTERSIRAEKYELTRWQSGQLRSKLPKGIYWLQIERGGLIQWNWTLLQSYLLSGADSLETLALVEEYVASLPTAA